MNYTQFIFQNHEQDAMMELSKNITEIPSRNPEKFVLQAKNQSNNIPKRLKYFLDDFMNCKSPTGYILISNIPIEDKLPQTPPDNKSFLGEKTIMAKFQAIISEYLGEMIAYEAEGYGNIFQDMVPKKELSYSQTSLGSGIELEIHTEQAFSSLKPDILALGCLRGDSDAKTYTLHVSEIIKRLKPPAVEALLKPLWKIGVDESFKSHGAEFIEGELRGPIPILYESGNDMQLVFDQDLMVGTTQEAVSLRKELIEIYYNHRNYHILKPGELLLIDNRRTVHGRSPFFPIFDGNDRFIVRSFISFDYKVSAYARFNGGRTIAAKYS
jgi:L-asparagine oxygenase